MNKLLRKILRVLPGSWESKVNAITKDKDLEKLTMDELIGRSTQRQCRKDTIEKLGAGSEDGPSSFDSIFALMAKSDCEDDEEVNFLDI
ncbi:hypothetical protein HAX54_047801 [Datura stramonium]|uniref:Uncharacterized protein n=1 Tax=Datura stramonium TaxID=4076 RepID=A0ABS8RRV6_DATST|nr:hypothetical protein [Datura stramonium]